MGSIHRPHLLFHKLFVRRHIQKTPTNILNGLVSVLMDLLKPSMFSLMEYQPHGDHYEFHYLIVCYQRQGVEKHVKCQIVFNCYQACRGWKIKSRRKTCLFC